MIVAKAMNVNALIGVNKDLIQLVNHTFIIKNIVKTVNMNHRMKLENHRLN